ncbi:hypothetical protein [Poseidonibacter parvus]|nr:hypothetical protein [Poseidonibacter parvus]
MISKNQRSLASFDMQVQRNKYNKLLLLTSTYEMLKDSNARI